MMLKKNKKKVDFEVSVLNRFKNQLDFSNVKIKHTLKPDFSWAISNVEKILNKHFSKNFILLFPFCSPKLLHKKWPYFNDLIKIIKNKHENIEIAVAPGPDEIEEANKIESNLILDNNKSLNIMQLAGLIMKARYIIANDTGPAHMAAHLGKVGTVLFGHHTTAEKVSIETDKFKAITVKDLNQLTAENVYSKIRKDIELIN